MSKTYGLKQLVLGKTQSETLCNRRLKDRDDGYNEVYLMCGRRRCGGTLVGRNVDDDGAMDDDGEVDDNGAVDDDGAVDEGEDCVADREDGEGEEYLVVRAEAGTW